MTASTAPAIRNVDHLHVFVVDLAAAELWYERVLGFTRAAEYASWAGGAGPLTIQNREGTVHIALFEGPAQKSRSTIALGVGAAEFVQWQAHLTQQLAQAPTFRDHRLSLSLYFSDPDDNPYEITTYEYEDAKSRLATASAA